MHDNIQSLLPDNLSDEAAYHLGNFFYELALAFESIHLVQLRRYEKLQVDLKHDLTSQESCQNIEPEKEPSF
jgi:hypothetical protein